VVAALLKGTRSYPEREYSPERDVLLLTLLDSGQDLVAEAGPEIFAVATEQEPLTPVALNLAIEKTLYNGRTTRLRATRIEIGDGDERQEASEPDFDDSIKAVRKQLREYRKRLAS
jgi:hypothetical protein